MTPTSTQDVYSREVRQNPQPFYEQFRETSPIFRYTGKHTGNHTWFFLNYDDCVAVLKDNRFGKDAKTNLPPELAKRYYDAEIDAMFSSINRNMLFVDPPDHTRLRSLVHKAFTPRMIQNLSARTEEITAQLLSDIQARGDEQIDLIEEFAFPVPITVISEMLGVPPEDRDKFKVWSDVVIRPSGTDNAVVRLMEMAQYIGEMIDERREDPRDDILSGLVHAEEDGDTLNRMELLSMVWLLLVAGHETTVNLIGNGTLLLMQHPEQMKRLQSNPELIDTAIEEILRFNGPVETPTIRYAFEDIEVSGVTIPQGDMVLPVLHAANRDPQKFDKPNTFDITRNPNPHIEFGHGIHYCLGAPLARMEGRIAMNALLACFPQINLAVDEKTLAWNNNITLHGLETLPVNLA